MPQLRNPQSFNRYSYVQNDPVNFVDPSGLYSSDYWNRLNQIWFNGHGFNAAYNSWNLVPRVTEFEFFHFHAHIGDNVYEDYYIASWGFMLTGRPRELEPTEATDDGIPNPDPCAGVTPSNLDYSRVRPYRQGGRQSAEQHIRSRHMSGNIRKASQYFGSFNNVKSYNSLTFTFGERIAGSNGTVIFQLEFPFSIGTDKFERSLTTGWNLLRLEKDCKTVDTSHPGPIR